MTVREIESEALEKTLDGCYYIIKPKINSFKDTSTFVEDNLVGKKIKPYEINKNVFIELPIYFDGKYYENLKIKFKLWKGEKIKKIVEIDKISIRKIQQSLNDKKTSLFKLEFNDKASLIITHDNIYVNGWNSTCPSVKNLKSWNIDMEDAYEELHYVIIEDFELEDLEKIFNKMFEQCIYTMKKKFAE